MRYIDMHTWSRREHFKLYCRLEHPHFGICANVNLTNFYPFIKKKGGSFNIATVYILARAANTVPEFRQRIRGEAVVEHEVIHPSTTILADDDLFTFCTVEYTQDFTVFTSRAEKMIKQVKENLVLEDEPGRDDWLFMTAIPWITFTYLMHPNVNSTDSVPRIAWGKFFEDGPTLKMPLGVQAHHGLIDGIHLAKFYDEVQKLFDQPEYALGR